MGLLRMLRNLTIVANLKNYENKGKLIFMIIFFSCSTKLDWQYKQALVYFLVHVNNISIESVFLLWIDILFLYCFLRIYATLLNYLIIDYVFLHYGLNIKIDNKRKSTLKLV